MAKSRWSVNIYRDFSLTAKAVGDFRELIDGDINFVAVDNAIGSLSFNTSLRKIYNFTKQHNFDVKQFFTPIRTSIILRDEINKIDVWGGVLTATPEIQFNGDGSDDYAVSFNFSTWDYLAKLYYLDPQNATGALDTLLLNAINKAITASQAGIRPWPWTIGHMDALAVVDNPVNAEKNLYDYLTERTDNSTGAGPFHISFSPDAKFEIFSDANYGFDVSDTTTLSFPSRGQLGGVTSVDFPEWANYYSNVKMLGSGNGDAAISTVQSNSNTLANTGFAMMYTQESDISNQTTLDQKATAFLRYTDKPFSNPVVTILRDVAKNVGFIVGDHRKGGTLWLGDRVSIKINGINSEILPFQNGGIFRIKQIEGVIHQSDDLSMKISFVSPQIGQS